MDEGPDGHQGRTVGIPRGRKGLYFGRGTVSLKPPDDVLGVEVGTEDWDTVRTKVGVKESRKRL